jgi:hypothetical protein
MGGWLKSNDPKSHKRIEKILVTMEKSYVEGNGAAKPDRITMNTVTAAYSKSGNTRSFEKSIEFRRSLEQKYRIKPDSISHNIVVDSYWLLWNASTNEEKFHTNPTGTLTAQ